MIDIRKANERGHADHGWLNSRHTFSFADYYDERFMGFGPLRVINEDRVQPAGGFPTHSHRDMEIVSYVLEGALEHRDSLGTGSVIRPGDVQRMSAGTGVSHSEFNPSRTDLVHFLQIWIVPRRAGLPPSYEQKTFADEQKRNRLRLIAAEDARDGAVAIHQNVDLYASLLDEGKEIAHTPKGRACWIQVASGSISIAQHRLEAGDGVALLDEGAMKIVGVTDSHFLVFDLG